MRPVRGPALASDSMQSCARRLRGCLWGVAVAVLAAGCSGGVDDDEADDATDPAAAVAAADSADTTDVVAGLEGGSGARPDTGADVAGAADDASDDSGELRPIDPLDIAGEIISEYSLVDGDCFNRFEGLAAGRRLAITARVDCDEPHWAEVYHTFSLEAAHPAVFPGDDAVRGYALRVCYEQFDAFVGEVYELSAYEIGVFTPNRTNFEHDVARYRGVHCWLYDTDEDLVSGTAAGAAR